MSEAVAALLRLNLVAAAAIGFVLILRVPARRLFGPRIAYGLWSLVAFAVAAMLTPARTVVLARPEPPAAPDALVVMHQGFAPTLQLAATPDLSKGLALLWIGGGLAALLWLARSQARFDRALREGRAGPAVVGVVRPRIVAPSDFAQRYSPSEQRLVLAHETTHIRRQDSRVNALVALLRCANWFNPAIHLMARYLRIDQEFACDAQVMARHPRARRVYGEAMLKTQLSTQPLPLGCYWPAPAAHPLVERIRLLSRPRPGVLGRSIGMAVVGLISLAGATTVWATRPARVVLQPSPQALAAAPLALRPVTAPRIVRAPAQPPVLTPKISSPPALSDEPPTLAPIDAAEGAKLQAAGFRLMPDGFFGPPRRIRGLADWSSVEPGSAVRVVAAMKDPDGVPLVTDLTAFGSQSRYRLGYIVNAPSRYRLFTRVAQHGDRFLVTAGLNRNLWSFNSATIELAAGETGTIVLPNGLKVVVTPTVRAETAEEIAEGRARARVDVEMSPRAV